MYHIIEIPNNSNDITIWNALDEIEVVVRMEQKHLQRGITVWEETTLFDATEVHGESLVTRHMQDWMYDDPDTPLYRRFDRQYYSPEPVHEWQTYLDFNAQFLARQMVYKSNKDVVRAYNSIQTWDFEGGHAIRRVLGAYLRRNQLIDISVNHNSYDHEPAGQPA